LRNPFFWDR